MIFVRSFISIVCDRSSKSVDRSLAPASNGIFIGNGSGCSGGKLLGHLCDFVSCYHSHCAGDRCRCRLDCGSYHICYSSRFPSVFLRRRSDLGLLCGPNRSSKLCSDFFATFGVTCGRYYGALSGIWVDDLMRSFPAFR
mgnify:CR=1 FL=1